MGRRQSSELDSDKLGPWQKTLGGLFCSCGACGMSRRPESEVPRPRAPASTHVGPRSVPTASHLWRRPCRQP